MEIYEAQLIREALASNKGDVQAAIETLGLPRKTFYDKLSRHGIDRASFVPKSADRGRAPCNAPVWSNGAAYPFAGGNMESDYDVKR